MLSSCHPIPSKSSLATIIGRLRTYPFSYRNLTCLTVRTTIQRMYSIDNSNATPPTIQPFLLSNTTDLRQREFFTSQLFISLTHLQSLNSTLNIFALDFIRIFQKPLTACGSKTLDQHNTEISNSSLSIWRAVELRNSWHPRPLHRIRKSD
jgi:hypothetical protein